MKRFLIGLAIVLLLAIVGLAVFLATFDVDRFRPQLVSQLQAALGKPVKLQHISLGWENGIAVQFQGFLIEEGAGPSHEPLIQVESAHALVRLMPLLHKNVQVSSIVLTRPRILVSRDANGHLNLTGLVVAASPTAASGKTATVNGKTVAFHVASLRINGGSVHWIDAATQPPTELWLNALDIVVKNIAPGQPMDVEAKGTVGTEASGLHVRGRLTPPGPTQPGSMEQIQLTIDKLPIEQVFAPIRQGEPYLRGRLTASLRGSVSTLEPAALLHAISASGTLKLTDPRVVNLNVLRAVFEKFSMIPGLVQTIENRLPPEYQAKFAANDTVLSPLDLTAQLQDGALRFDELTVSSETFRISGSGRVGLDGTLALRSMLRIEPAFSGALMRSVKELQYLTNTAGEMEIPLTIQGQAPRVAILPDLNYVASKLLVTKVEDLLGNILQKALEKNKPAGAPTSP